MEYREKIEEQTKQRAEKTEKAIADIQTLPDEETEAVAGGYCTGFYEFAPGDDPECGRAQGYYKEHGEWCTQIEYSCSGIGNKVWIQD